MRDRISSALIPPHSLRRGTCAAGTAVLTAALIASGLGTAQAAVPTSLVTAPATTGSTVTAPADVVTDRFARTVTGGWGTASLGGDWAKTDTKATYAVSGGAGTHRVPSGVTSAIYLNSLNTTDADTRVDIAFDRPSGSGSAAYASVLGRAVRGASDYRARLIVTRSGSLDLQIARGATALRTVPLSDLGYAPGARTTVRFQATGTSPTTLRAKAWRAGTAEPAGWDIQLTDGDPTMQAAGRLGISTYVSSAPAPVTASYADLHVAPSVVPNLPPTSAFTFAAEDQKVVLDGSGSSDPDGSIVSYRWDHGDGSVGEGTTASHTYAAPGTYPVELTVTDDRGATSTVTRTVSVVAPNVLPTARFTVSTEDQVLSVDASSSTDVDGDLVSYGWSFGDGTTGAGAQASHTYERPGTYTVGLTVTDDRGGVSRTSRTVTAIAPNVLPTADFAAEVDDLAVALDGSASHDADGTLQTYAWNFGDGTIRTGRTVTHRYAAPGDYVVTLTVTDDRGGITKATRTVTAIAPNVLPTADFTAGVSDLSLSFDASPSSDSDGTLETYAWDFGDGTIRTGRAVTHEYAAPGDYTVTLTVTDDRGGVSRTTHTVTAIAPNVPPTASFAADVDDLDLALDASASADTDGSLRHHAWDLGDGTTATGRTVEHRYATPGEYAVTLTVTDDRGGVDTTSRTVTAVAPNVLPTADFAADVDDLTVALDASASTDTDGALQTYAWDLGDGTVRTGRAVTHAYDTPGEHTVTLRVTDDRGGITAVARTVTVVAPNVAPTADFTADVTRLDVTLDAAASADTDGVLTSYRWDLGDGTTQDGPRVQHSFPSSGTYTVRLTVTDDRGATAVSTRDLSVVAPTVSVPFYPLEPSPEPTPEPVAVDGDALQSFGWKGKEEAAAGRITSVTGAGVPGSGVGRPDRALRFELLDGDRTTTGGSYVAPRTEVHGRHPSPWSTPYQSWPDPAGSQRWYAMNVFVPEDFTTATDSKWLTITQWKGLNGGSPPIALEIKRDNLRLGGTRTNAGLIPNDGNLGKLAKGRWTEIVVGMGLSTDKSQGWVEVYRDGALALPRTSVATMDLIGGTPDPVYLKQGLYRSTAWTVDHVLYFSPVTVSEQRITSTR